MPGKKIERSSRTKMSITKDPMYAKMTVEQKKSFDNAFKILFAGDLILLEDQVKNAYDGFKYNFDECFEYTKSYIKDADLSIGVFEGPMAGYDAGYSSSNYGDGKKLAVNFPDEWAHAINEAGFDYVTTANNHALDKDLAGLRRTCSILEKSPIDYSGTYTSQEEKEAKRVKILEYDNLKIAILTYTFAINHYNVKRTIGSDLSYVTSMLVPESSEYFDKAVENVKRDFQKARESNADIIIVMPHWGTQFADYPNSNQLNWERLFKEFGADIILGDHTHSVQPVYVDGAQQKNTFTAYCPGNYANIYRKHGGDFSAMIEVYIDRETKNVIGGAVIPMWTASKISGNYRPIPIYKILTEDKIKEELTTFDLARVKKAQEHIADVMLGERISVNFPQKRYYFNEDGFMREKCEQLPITDEMKNGIAYKTITEADNVCFVGDSITEGTCNGGVGWFEPVEDIIRGKFYKRGWGSTTTRLLLRDHLDEILEPDADLYVVAVGTNDVRYRNEEKCSMTPSEYTQKLQFLKEKILQTHPSAKFMFIAPWISTDGDKVSKLSYSKKIKMNRKYTIALKKWADKQGDVFIDANPHIDECLSRYPHSEYMIDAIHPNATKGLQLYAAAVLLYDENGKKEKENITMDIDNIKTYQDMFDYIDTVEDMDELDDMADTYKENFLRGEFWKYRREYLITDNPITKKQALVKCRYILHLVGSTIPLTRRVHRFKCPHGLKGIFISAGAKIGKGCTLFQHVTIGSNTMPGSKNAGVPVVGENCFFGANSSVIGNVKIGNNCRIGANCIVVEDIPDNSVVVMDKGAVKVIQKKNLDNSFVGYSKYLELKKQGVYDEKPTSQKKQNRLKRKAKLAAKKVLGK